MQEEPDLRGEQSKKLQKKVSFAPSVKLFPPIEYDDDDDDDDEEDEVMSSQRTQLLAAMKEVMRGKGRSFRKRAERLSILSAPHTEDSPGETVKSALLDHDANLPDAVFASAAPVCAGSEGTLRFIPATDRARPPQWLCRWSDLFLFRNATGAFASIGGDAVGAALVQLSGDEARAQAQAETAGDETGGEEAEGPLLAADPPLWRRPGARADLTRRLAELLSEHLAELRSVIGSDARNRNAGLFGAPVFGGADGTQRGGQCPLLQRVHAAVMAGAVLDDVYMRREPLCGGRARRIDYSYPRQMPQIHTEFFIEERAKSAYDPMCIGTIRAHKGIPTNMCLSSPVASLPAQIESRQSDQSVFFLRIEYVRFQPPDGLATQAQHVGTSPCALAGLPVPRNPIRHQAQKPCGEKPMIEFSPEEELISRILDNYEPYRMMQLGLVPGIRSRGFYQYQLQRLRRKPHQSEDVQKLLATVSKIHRVTAKLERYYTHTMLKAWEEIAALRGDTTNPVMHMSLQAVDSDTTADPPLALSIDAAPKLLDNTPGQSARFQWYLCPRGESVPEDDLADYIPVVEGAGAMPPGEGHPQFQVLVFARTGVMVPPQFVGATMPCALSLANVLFINETFELRGMREPEEIILHVVPVADSMDYRVISSVNVRPSRTLVHRLLPFKTPVTFTYRDRLQNERRGDAVNGVISLTTTWAATEKKTLEEIEDTFLRGDADPLDPQYESLLGILRRFYTETPRTVAVASAPPSEKRGHTDTKGTHPSPLHVPQPVLFSHTGETGGERAALLRRRWLVRVGRAAPRRASEAELFSRPLPVSEAECRALATSARRGDAVGKGKEADTMRSGMSTLSPLSRSAKLERWRQQLRSFLALWRPSMRQEDHESLERIVAMPRLRMPKFAPIRPERQLNPRRESRPKTDEINRDALVSRQDSRILVHIMKATALPHRADGTPLEPFFEVSFVYETVHSRSDVGTAPVWFETLEIPFCPPDFEDETLSMIEDDILISLYDKVEIQMAPTTVTTGAVAHETHYRTERRLIGTLRVPFFSLFEAEQARMEGQYALETPRWILGYQPLGSQKASSSSFISRHLHSATNAKVTATAYPSVQLYIALSPPLRRERRRELDHLAVYRQVTQQSVSAQLQHLHSIALDWRRDALRKVKGLSSVNPIAKQREIEPFVFCTKGYLTLVCRYLIANGGPPPPEVRSPQEAIRFVSLLPFRIDTHTWGGEDVWSTNVELLSTLAGDYEEFSLLLAHFLRYLEPDEVTMIVTGRGTVHHQLVMVLHSFSGELRLIDPRTGRVCPVHDPHIPTFHDVHMVISHNQLWANMQLSGAPHRMGWNLEDKRLWMPCFDHSDGNVQACLPFIAPLQCEALTFEPPIARKVAEIERQLSEAVRHSLMTWRNNRQFALHHGATSVLCELLKEAERERCEYASVLQEEVTVKARELINEHFCEEVLQEPRHFRGRRAVSVQDHFGPRLRMMGCPVNDSYRPDDVGYQAILQRVFETAVHEVGTSAVSFAIAVYVKGYTSDVYSMWVFLAALYEVATPPPT